MEIQTFGECLRAWMRAHGYSNARLALLTREKSGTTISRLLNDQCTAQRCEAFLGTLFSSLDVSPAEAAQLRESIAVSRVGKAQYRADLVFHKLMTDAQSLTPASGMVCWDELMDLLAPFAQEGPCDVLCFGCFDAQVLGTLSALLRQAQSPLTVTHYFAEEQHADLIFLLEHTLLMLNDPRYRLVSIRGGKGLHASGVVMQDALVLRSASGATRLIIPVSGGAPLTQDFPAASDLFGFYQRALQADEALQHRYSSDFFRGSAMDYIAFMETCLSYETHRSIYHLKPDLGIEYIPVDILKRSFGAWIAVHPEYAYVSDGLIELGERRHQQLFSQRQTHVLVMSREAMTAFARTGRMSDHPFCLRPFTPEERAAILRYLTDHAQSNPFFTPLVLREGAAVPQHQLIAYEGLGLLICDTQTDYSLEGYSEIFLRSPLVAEQFKAFLLNEVCRDQAESPKASVRFLEGLAQTI